MAISPWKAVHPEPRLRPTAAFRPIHWTADWSLAIGFWDKRRALLIRWNGDPGPGKGNPMSHTFPTWFVMPDWTILEVVAEPNKSNSSDWLDGGEPAGWVDPVPNGWGDY